MSAEPGPRPAPPGWIPPETFGVRLRRIREHLDLTIEEAAAKCGLSAGTWRTWEHGARPRDKEEIAQVVSACTGCNRLWLLAGHHPQGSTIWSIPLGDGQMELDLDDRPPLVAVSTP